MLSLECITVCDEHDLGEEASSTGDIPFGLTAGGGRSSRVGRLRSA
jgi:hypothetical protein